MLPVVTQLLHDDKKVRVVFREFPILSEDSVSASRAALAVNRIAPDKYFDFHTALMKSNGKFDEKMLLATGKKLGIDPKKLKGRNGKARTSPPSSTKTAPSPKIWAFAAPRLISNEAWCRAPCRMRTLKENLVAEDPQRRREAAPPNG